jgi:HEAT repeat protein
MKHTTGFLQVAALGIALFCISVPQAQAYIDGGGQQITLPEVLLEFHSIAIVHVDKCDAKRGVIRYKLIEQLKGKKGGDAKHQIQFDGQPPRLVMEMKSGQIAMIFTECFDNRSLGFLEGHWYWTTPIGDGWERGPIRDDFQHTFAGTAAELADTVKKLLRGKAVVVRCKSAVGADLEFVRYTIRDAHRKALVPDPAGPSFKDKPVADWTKRLSDKDARIRLQAALALAQYGPAAKAAVSGLCKVLQADSSEVRYAAATALGAIGPEAKAGLNALIHALDDKDWFVAVAAAQALEKLGPAAKAAVPALTRVLQPRDAVKDYRPIRCAAVALALVKIDPQAKVVKPALALVVDKLLDDDRQDNDGSRVVGAQTLGQFGPAAKPAVGALVRRLKDKDATVRIAAADALMKIQPEQQAAPAIQILTAELKNPDVLCRILAAEALGVIGPSAQSATSALAMAARDADPDVRAAATAALERIAPK